jgi:hypothetical protein
MSRQWITALGTFMLFSILTVGQTNQSSKEGFSSAGLSNAAEKTYANYNRAFQAGIEKRQTEATELEIPSKYWTDPIKALKPVKVYVHRINVVVVQGMNNGIEMGKYIYIPISSFLPTNGVDGFEFTPNPQKDKNYILQEALDFRRVRSR